MGERHRGGVMAMSAGRGVPSFAFEEKALGTIPTGNISNQLTRYIQEITV